MISLDFDLNEKQNQLDVHEWDKNIVLVAHNGYSYVRVVVPKEELSEFIKKLNKNNDEAELV
jgi:hypothetical protein